MILVIDNYDSFTYNLVHYLGDLGADLVVHRNDKVSVEEIKILDPDAIIISPGPCTPNEAGICLDLIKALGDHIPMFGVCLGFQSIGQAHGGKVIHAPYLMHGKVSQVTHSADGVFEGLPERLPATRYHSLMLDRDSLPDVFQITSETEDGLVMGIAHKTLPLHGVLFHPESIASEGGHDILRNFLSIAADWNVKTGRRHEDNA